MGAIQEAIDKGESAAELWVVKDSALEQIKLLAALAESVLPGAGLLNCVASELKDASWSTRAHPGERRSPV